MFGIFLKSRIIRKYGPRVFQTTARPNPLTAIHILYYRRVLSHVPLMILNTERIDNHVS